MHGNDNGDAGSREEANTGSAFWDQFLIQSAGFVEEAGYSRSEEFGSLNKSQKEVGASGMS